MYDAVLAAALKVSGRSHDERLPARVEGWAWDVGITPANYFVPTPHRYPAFLVVANRSSVWFAWGAFARA